MSSRALRPALLRSASPSPTTTHPLHLRALSTTPILSAGTYQKKSTRGPGQATRPRRILEPGESQAIKRKVNLGNPNAHNVPLPGFNARTLLDQQSVGRMFKFSERTVGKLMAAEAFRPKSNWEVFSSPATLVRPESREIGTLMEWVTENIAHDVNGRANTGVSRGNNQRWAARILHGKKGSGKSILLMQAMAHALENGWVVLNIPEARDLVISHTAYEFDPASKTWLQRDYVGEWLQRILNVNRETFAKIPVTLASRATQGQQPKQGMTLVNLCEAAAYDPTLNIDVFESLLAELSLPDRPPVLFAYENLNVVCAPTLYRAPDFTYIHGFDFAITKLLLDLLNYRRGFNKSLTLAATSLSTPPPQTSINHGLKKTTPDPYEKVDHRVIDELKPVSVIDTSVLSQGNGRVLLDYVRASGLLRDEVPCGIPGQDQFAEKYAVSGGVIGELMKTALLPRSF